MGKSFEQELGERIRDIRLSKNPRISMEALAERAGLSRQTINNLELGNTPNVSLQTVLAISKALEVSIGLLAGEENLPSEGIRAVEAVKAIYRQERDAK
jgi:transcriptional regulator with XRE-family HTH domain